MALRARFKRESRDAVMRRLRQLVPEAEAQIAKAQEASMKELAEAIKARAPVDTGEYRNSIRADLVANNPGKKPVGVEQTKDPNAWAVYANYIWKFIEYGTKQHVVKAKKKPYLVFNVGGRQVRKKQVTVPEIDKRPHVFTTYRAMRKRILRRMSTAIRKAINGKK